MRDGHREVGGAWTRSCRDQRWRAHFVGNRTVPAFRSDGPVLKFDDHVTLQLTKSYISADPADSPETAAMVPSEASGATIASAVVNSARIE